MNRWERNMYEDRIAIISQQRLLLEQNKAGTGEVLLNRSLNPNKRSYTKFQTQQPQAQQQAQTVLFLDQPSVSQQQVVNYAEVPDSKRRCVQLKPPVPSRYQGYVRRNIVILIDLYIMYYYHCCLHM